VIRELLIFGAVLIVLVGSVVVDYNLYRGSGDMKILSKLTTITSPSLSVAYYEPRVLYIDRATNIAYPSMPSINRGDFIYEE
jgi:hypothetical protein